MQIFHTLTIKTDGQGLYDFTKKTSEWLNLISNSPLEINSNNEFKPISE